MTNADTDIQELSNFLLDFATTLMGVGKPYFAGSKECKSHCRVVRLWGGYDYFSA